uniref:uncharacterized protein LOC120329028 isoform X1 n=1 Tax=Styela clava TaxID=7725 RepID=UPI001939EA1B|nr:uncharacterized protein LOC120329028 isoform X1 [Styela clava]
MKFRLIKFLLSICVILQEFVHCGKTLQADSEENISKKICEFPQFRKLTKKIIYNNKTHFCQGCKTFRTLFLKADAKKLNLKNVDMCTKKCDGVLCSGLKLECVQSKVAGETAEKTCEKIGGRAVNPWHGGSEEGGNNNAEDGRNASGQIPLIVGFTVGGILLAIVVAGIFLGRNQKNDDGDGSEMMTTPVSLSNSEWHSNGVSNIARRNQENLRVQEASTEDLTTVPMYEIRNDNKVYRQDENGNEYLLKNEDECSTMSRTSYNGSDLFPYFAQMNSSPMRSNRSSDVVLEDGYVTGGNFIGSADPQIREFLRQNTHTSKEGNEAFVNDKSELEQNYYMTEQLNATNEALSMSLTHSVGCDGVEYVIEDQDLVSFNTPVSFSKQKRTPQSQRMRRINENHDIMQITLQPGDLDSDFEDNSRPDSAVKSDKSEVFFSPTTQSLQAGENSAFKTDNSFVESPCSESGIEGSYNSKESCEILLNNDDPPIHSWNENGKGRSSERLVEKTRTPKINRYLANGGNRAKSCTWKSPAAPTHSSSRKLSVPIHCPSSVPTHPKPHATNLTHVFVDVHRNMASSDEDLLGHTSINNKSCERPFRANLQSSSSTEMIFGALQNTPDHMPFDAYTSQNNEQQDGLKINRQRRNKSMYLLRNGGIHKTPDWAPPRTVRFSSSGSGEYAIPFGSLVP